MCVKWQYLYGLAKIKERNEEVVREDQEGGDKFNPACG
jgi:hypothetical protein